ncbi:MAG: hypothetical protein QOE57_678, partial [Acidimicrobiaceae bacterium]|nr:hypothetical protein [Acidimicrobiaceae bacterium]
MGADSDVCGSDESGVSGSGAVAPAGFPGCRGCAYLNSADV